MPSNSDKPVLTIAVAIIQSEDRVLIARRKHGTHLGGLWEFPGGKVSDDETVEHALVRECREELAIEISSGELLHREEHEYDDRCVDLRFHRCHHVQGEPRALESEEVLWVKLAELDNYEFPEANAKILSTLTAEC